MYKIFFFVLLFNACSDKAKDKNNTRGLNVVLEKSVIDKVNFKRRELEMFDLYLIFKVCNQIQDGVLHFDQKEEGECDNLIIKSEFSAYESLSFNCYGLNENTTIKKDSCTFFYAGLSSEEIMNKIDIEYMKKDSLERINILKKIIPKLSMQFVYRTGYGIKDTVSIDLSKGTETYFANGFLEYLNTINKKSVY